MDRIILFRAKKINNPNDFVYGTYLKDVTKAHPYIIVDEMGGYHPIDKNTLGQYICAVDLEGTKIFEGDILFENLENIYDVVAYNEELASFTLEINDFDIVDGVLHDWDKVAGNIYDNKELLDKSN